MLRIGLTGGIGSGKSTVAALFARRGVPVIDTDEIARDIVRIGEPALDGIVREFGKEMTDAHGNLDRARLRERVFDDADARKRLEAILHPRIRACVRERVGQLTAPCCLIVVPLLVETGFDDLIDRVLVIDVDEAHQVERTSTRDKVSRDAVRKILAVQATRAERSARADDIITNNGTPEALAGEVARLHAQYLKLAGAT